MILKALLKFCTTNTKNLSRELVLFNSRSSKLKNPANQQNRRESLVVINLLFENFLMPLN